MVDSTTIYNVLEKNKFELFENDKLKSNTHVIWTKISKQLGHNITPLNLFISVYKDRHEYQTELKSSLNISQSSDLVDEQSDDENIVSCVESEDTDAEIDKNFELFNSNKEKSFSTTLFHLNIPFEKYMEIKPLPVLYNKKNKKRKYEVLKQSKWSDVINDAFLNEYKLPCNYIYKRNKVSIDKSNSKYYLTFYATCKDCGNKLSGWSENEPNNGDPLLIKICTVDTR